MPQKKSSSTKRRKKVTRPVKAMKPRLKVRKKRGKATKKKRNPKLIYKTSIPEIKKIFIQYRKRLAKRVPEVIRVKLQSKKGLHDSKRHWGAYVSGTKSVQLDPGIVSLPPSKVRGVILHELGHAVIHLSDELTEPKGYDARERMADRAVEKILGTKIYYARDDKVQTAGPGARGIRPRPKGLR